MLPLNLKVTNEIMLYFYWKDLFTKERKKSNFSQFLKPMLIGMVFYSKNG